MKKSKREPSWLVMGLKKIKYLFKEKKYYREFAGRLPLTGSEQVLEFEAGMGYVANFTLQRLDKGQLTCYHSSNKWLKLCERTLRKYHHVSFLNAPINTLPLDTFDVIYCHLVLHEIENYDLETIIPSLVKALKVNGLFVFKEPFTLEKIKWIQKLMADNQLKLMSSRITDMPGQGNVIENIYQKNK